MIMGDVPLGSTLVDRFQQSEGTKRCTDAALQKT